VAGELERRRPSPAELDAEGARLGASFGLGGPYQGVCLARRRSSQWGCGGTLIVAALSVIVVPEWQHHYSPGWVAAAIAVAVAG
jgi:hypothetical protein